MSRKTIGLGLIIIGILALAISLFADYLGFSTDTSEIGWLQLLGMGIGLVVAVLGVFYTIQKEK